MKEKIASQNTKDIDKLLGIESDNLLSISQSLIKNFWDYQNGTGCGTALYLINILHKYEIKPTVRMKLGQYFEYVCTGQVLRDGVVPERPVLKSGKPTSDAVKVETQAERFNNLLKAEEIKILETGTVLEHKSPDMGFKVKGVLDALVEVDGEKAILDIKSSGLLGNKWEDFGWDAETFHMRDKLTIQVVFYKYLAWKVMNIKDIPFYYAIHSTTNSVDSAFWEVKLSDFEVAMSHLEDMILEVVELLQKDIEVGFTPFPSVKRCEKCPVFNDCEHKRVTPEKEVIVIDGIYIT